MVISFIKKNISEKVTGMLDYYRRPELKNSLGGPFNGQTFRQQIFIELINRLHLTAIVETGTYLGTTTEYMCNSSGLKVYTAEKNPWCFGYIKSRFFWHKKISAYHGDSRLFLLQLAENPGIIKEQAFFYLDAHWENDLPLREEVGIIFTRWGKAVIMIDDFAVPDDKGYGYDDYGECKVLCLDYLSPLDFLRLEKFFPAIKSEIETGEKRGCIVLAKDPEMIKELKSFKTLVCYVNQE